MCSQIKTWPCTETPPPLPCDNSSMKQYLCLVFAIRSCFSLSHAHTCLQLLSGCSSAVFSLRCTLLVSNSSPSVCCWHHLAPSLQSSSSCFLCMCESLYTTQELLNASNCSCNNLGVEDMSWIISICRCKLSPPPLWGSTEGKKRLEVLEELILSGWEPVSYWLGKSIWKWQMQCCLSKIIPFYHWLAA